MTSADGGRHPFEILGIDKTTPLAEARKKQRQFNLAHHPDRGVVDEIAQDELSRINAFITKWAAAVRDGKEFDFELGGPELVEEDPFADFEEMKQEAKIKASSKYPPRDGEDIRISKSIDLAKIDSSRIIKVTVTGDLKLSAYAGKTNFPLRVPDSFKSGLTLKLSGKGKPGLFGGRNGDLFITLLVREARVSPPPAPPPRPTPTVNTGQDPDVFENITPVTDVGDKRKWMIGVAVVIIFIIIKLLSAHGSVPNAGTYNNQTTTDTSGGQTTTDTSGGQTTTDTSGGQTTTGQNPATPPTDGPAAGAIGDLGNGSTTSNVQPSPSSGDPGASGNL